MTTATVYKIVTETRRSLTDWFPEHLVAHYPVGEQIEPYLLGSRFFAFGSLEAAYVFRPRKGLLIFEAEGVDPVDISLVARDFDSVHSYWRSWKRRLGHPDSTIFNLAGTQPAPFGTVGCTAIKLVRQLTEEEIEETLKRTA